MSLPVRECGLKPNKYNNGKLRWLVTPRAGVWIETSISLPSSAISGSHSPCGSVD